MFRADADLKLLGSRRLPKDAFKDKVVWITGASQVLFSSCGPPAVLSNGVQGIAQSDAVLEITSPAAVVLTQCFTTGNFAERLLM